MKNNEKPVDTEKLKNRATRENPVSLTCLAHDKSGVRSYLYITELLQKINIEKRFLIIYISYIYLIYSINVTPTPPYKLSLYLKN